jgi:PilZ domain
MEEQNTASQPNQLDPALLDVARCVLPSPPSKIRLRTAQGETLPATLVDYFDHGLVVNARCGAVASGESCRITVGDGALAWYEIDLRAIGVHPLGLDERLRLVVAAVRRAKSRRTAPRALVVESAVVETTDDTLDVDLVDVGAYGFAFSCTEPFQIGESLSAILTVDRRVISTTAKVTNLSRIGARNVRVGCRFTRIAEHHRALLDEIAHATPVAVASSSSALAAQNSALVRRLDRVPAREDVDAASGMRWRFCSRCARLTYQRWEEAPEPGWRCENSHTAGC